MLRSGAEQHSLRLQQQQQHTRIAGYALSGCGLLLLTTYDASIAYHWQAGGSQIRQSAYAMQVMHDSLARSASWLLLQLRV